MSSTTEYDVLKQQAVGNPEASAILEAGIANGDSAGAIALAMIQSGAIVPATDDAWTAVYNSNADLQAEFDTLETFLAFKRAEASGRLHLGSYYFRHHGN